ncbi:MAG TPA: hypothetical protein VMF10_12670 [Candidatus Aquilonibacter sp.]|nr:hypothetical protein [Candidatus Aquilonibacter sp.]
MVASFRFILGANQIAMPERLLGILERGLRTVASSTTKPADRHEKNSAKGYG